MWDERSFDTRSFEERSWWFARLIRRAINYIDQLHIYLTNASVTITEKIMAVFGQAEETSSTRITDSEETVFDKPDDDQSITVAQPPRDVFVKTVKTQSVIVSEAEVPVVIDSSEDSQLTRYQLPDVIVNTTRL